MVKAFRVAYVVPDRLVRFLLARTKSWSSGFHLFRQRAKFIKKSSITYSKSATLSSFKVLNQISAWSSIVSPNVATLVVSMRGSYARHICLNLSTWSYASPKPRKRGTRLEMEALFLLSFVGFLEFSVGARSFSINATRVWMDCNGSAISAFGGVEVV